MRFPFAIRVPATTANLGSGFDCLGLALALRNEIVVEPAPSLELEISGEGEGSLPRGPDNRVVAAMQAVCDAIGKPLPPVRLRMRHQIPLARGLGSSAAAAVGGLLAAHYYYDSALSDDALLKLATALEGHPDNVAPALLGGLCVVGVADGNPIAIKIVWPDALRLVVFVPEKPLATAAARAVLPTVVPRADAVFNLGRAALWIAAITQGRFDLLATAAQDRLHQPYRAGLIDSFDDILRAAQSAGARAAFLSGAGSSIAAVCDARDEPIGEAMRRAAERAGQRGRILMLHCDPVGARLVV